MSCTSCALRRGQRHVAQRRHLEHAVDIARLAVRQRLLGGLEHLRIAGRNRQGAGELEARLSPLGGLRIVATLPQQPREAV
jgi:hypothetical protein